MQSAKSQQSRRRKISIRLGLLLSGLVVGLICAEVALWALDVPRFYKRHASSGQFGSEGELIDGQFFYFNRKSAPIRFEYDGNPRGYFGPDNEVEHPTNSLGFRGPEFQLDKSPGTIRLMFLGDSFTFGEGVRFADTYCEVTSALLQAKINDSRRVEAYNFGVGGYNTSQSLWLLQRFLTQTSPDVILLGYVLNDAEPPLFDYDHATKSRIRLPRELMIPEGLDDAVPPDQIVYQLRSSRLVWQLFQNRTRSRATIAHYRSLYETAGIGWRNSRLALKQFIEICRSRDVPFCVVLFPILHELSDAYPFRDIHEQIAREFEGTGTVFIDLLPRLKGMDADELWVHPTDQHPNERVHAIAAEALVDGLMAHALFDQNKDVK